MQISLSSDELFFVLCAVVGGILIVNIRHVISNYLDKRSDDK